jgi:beta-galactosidase/beta-glucuronidase
MKTLPETIVLPGSMAERGKGDEPGVNSKWTGGIVDKSWFTDPKYERYRRPGNVKVPFWLTPRKVYVGAAWYQKEIDIPKDWSKKPTELFLERCHWETRLWVDGKEVGLQNSLSTPHVYDLSRVLSPGRHRLTLRIDNRIKDIDVGRNAHSVSDHTQTNWNGIVGKMELRALPEVKISDAMVYPDVGGKSARITIQLFNSSGVPQSGSLRIAAKSLTVTTSHMPVVKQEGFKLEGERGTVEVLYPMGDKALLWDEFAPNLYQLQIDLLTSSRATDRKLVQFGMREFKTAGTRFAVNGRPVFLRGTLECAIFPKTGYASMDVREWTRMFKVCKSYGLNHVRFHSWCPPEAAFVAADREGIYLYVECCAWTTVGAGKPFDTWLYEESERIVETYGNHPSFCMMSYGNEPAGDNQSKFLGEFVSYWKMKDSRRVYTSGAGWPLIPQSDFHLTDQPRIQRWGEGLKSIINKEQPSTDFDFRAFVS